MRKKFYTLNNDRMFKTIMLNDNNELLEKIISDILEEKITIKIVKPTELPILNMGMKLNVLDVVVETENHETINVEVNPCFDEIIKKRNIIYLATLCSQIAKKGKLLEDNKIIQINLNYNDIGHLKEDYMLIDRINGGVYSEDIRIINVNLVEYKRMWYDKNIQGDLEHIYLVMLSASKEEIEKLSKQDKLVREVEEKMFVINDDDSITRLVSYEEEAKMIQEARERYARNEGKKTGIKQTKNKIVKNMLKEHIPIETIIKTTNLSKEEIIKLQNN